MLGVSFTPSTGHNATAKAIAKEFGVNEKSVRRAGDYAKAVNTIKQMVPEAAEKILKGEVKCSFSIT